MLVSLAVGLDGGGRVIDRKIILRRRFAADERAVRAERIVHAADCLGDVLDVFAVFIIEGLSVEFDPSGVGVLHLRKLEPDGPAVAARAAHLLVLDSIIGIAAIDRILPPT